MTSHIGHIYTPIVAATMLLLAAAVGFAQDTAIAPTAISARPQGLWVGDYGSAIEYQGLKIRRSGTPFPDFGFKSAGLFADPIGMVFDRSHNLWFIFYGTAAVFELTQPQLSALARGGEVKPNSPWCKWSPLRSCQWW
jgi:hypothetical protein